MRRLRRSSRVELISTAPLHAGQVFDVAHEHVRLPSGLEQRLDVVVHGGAVCVAPILEDGRLLLVRQYRHAIGEWLLEIPAGRLEGGGAESPLAAAQRELEEETGHCAREWEELASFFPAPGFCSEHMVMYAARGLAALPGGGRALDPDEELELVRLTPTEVLALDRRDAKTLLACLLLTR